MSSTTDIEKEYKVAQKLILDVRAQLEEVESIQHTSGLFASGSGSQHSQSSTRARRTYQADEIEGGMVSPSAVNNHKQQLKIMELQTALTQNINKLSRSERSIRDMVPQLPMNKKDYWKREVENITEESRFLRRSVDKYLRSIHDTERDRELLMGAYKSTSAERRGEKAVMESLADQRSSMQRSKQVIEQMKDYGANLMSMLGEQSDTMRAAHRRVMDMGVTMGIVQSTLGMIQRRHIRDKWIVYTGMFLVSALLMFVFWWKFL
ncbi:golgi SNAP receptor complex member 2 [Acrasis kona]|uniref:Golgi SNAP receptor complex member 2 n=1 Tax=Acrasis kona TaxID=1008807 RepID=A0AAW2ZIK6_9EUKA